MTLLPRYKKLFKPYEADGCTIETMIAWLKKKSGAHDEIISLCVRNLFLELSHGRTFPTGEDSGCAGENVHSALVHHLLTEVLKLKDEADRAYWEVLEKVDHERILKHVELENAAYIAENTPKPGKIKRVLKAAIGL